MLGGEFAVLQAPLFDCLSFDPFSLFDDGLRSAEVGVCRCHIGQALVIAAVIVVLDKGLDLTFEIAWQEVVFEQNAVLEGLMPTLVCLGLTRRHWRHGPCSLPWVCG